MVLSNKDNLLTQYEEKIEEINKNKNDLITLSYINLTQKKGKKIKFIYEALKSIYFRQNNIQNNYCISLIRADNFICQKGGVYTFRELVFAKHLPYNFHIF